MTRREKLKVRRQKAARWQHFVPLCRGEAVDSTASYRLRPTHRPVEGVEWEAEDDFPAAPKRGYREWRWGTEPSRSHWAKAKAKAQAKARRNNK